jgi:hypothetical protein
MDGHPRAEEQAHEAQRQPQDVDGAMHRHRMKSLSLGCRVVRSPGQRRQAREVEAISNV